MKSGGYRRGGKGSGANKAQNTCHKQNLSMGRGIGSMGTTTRTLSPAMKGSYKSMHGLKVPSDFTT